MSAIARQSAPAARPWAWLVAAVAAAAIGAAFSAFVAVRMIAARGRMIAANPGTNPDLAALRDEIWHGPIAARMDEALAAETAKMRGPLAPLRRALARGAYLPARWAARTYEKRMRKQIEGYPDSKSLAKGFREMDLRLRGEFMAAQRVMSTGTYLLAGGLIAAIAGAVTALGLRGALPHPGRAPDGRSVDRLNAAVGRWVTLFLLAAVFGSSLALVVLSRPLDAMKAVERGSDGGERGGQTGPGPDGGPPHIPKPQDIARYWSRFRGPGGAATSAYKNIPTDWDGRDGPGKKNILWKTPLPLEGKNSPILWEKRLFLTAADKTRRLVLSIDAETGKKLWSCEVAVPGPPAPVPRIPGDTGYAPGTAVTDGRHVVAMFPNGDLACVDYDGKQLWARNLGLPDNGYGHAASLVMWRDRTLVLFDQAGPGDGMSQLLAFSSRSGKLLWVRPRDVGASWTTPIVIHAAGKDQVITSADPWVISYAPSDGSVIWRAKCMSGDVASSPIYAGGMVFVVHESADLVAIRPDGTGDVTKTHIAWKGDEGLPDITSPVSNGKQVWLLTSNGDLTCYDVKTGKVTYPKQMAKELRKPFNSSPSIVGEQLWLMDLKGTTTILAAGPVFKLLGSCELGEPIFASPVFADGRIYLRGAKNLYCIGGK